MKNGHIEQANFDTYNSMRIAEMPKVNRSSCRSCRRQRPLGRHRRADDLRRRAGHALNAYFKATGNRIRSFPLKNHNIQMS